MPGETELMQVRKAGTVSASVRVSEGGSQGVVEYYAEATIYDADGAQRSRTDINADLVAAIQQQRATQGATATPNPALDSHDFGTLVGL